MGGKEKRTNNSKIKCTITIDTEGFIDSSCKVIEIHDANQLASIFPEEIWLMIFVNKIGAKTKNGTDTLANISLSSLYFRKLLAHRRKIFLFPDVFRNLIIWLENQTHQNLYTSSSDESEEELDRPSLNSEVKLANILSCRLICSEWNKAIKNYYQCSKHYTLMKHDKDELSPNLGVIKMSMEYTDIARHPLSFLNHFKTIIGTTTSNPFTGRSIAFKKIFVVRVGSFDEENEYFRQGMLAVLQNHGINLWHCNMSLEDLTPSGEDLYFQLREWIASMPNLKTFKLSYSRLDTYTEFQEGAKLIPLRKLTDLQFLKVKNIAPLIFNEIIKRSGEKITQLEIIRNKEADDALEYDIYSEDQTIPQLKEVSINFKSVKQFEQMENSVMAMNWKLEKFYFLYDKYADFLDWTRLFQMISNKWSGSITNVVLQMQVSKSHQDKNAIVQASLTSSVFQLPYIKRLKLIVKDPCSIDFLLPLRNSLEDIEIVADYDVDEAKAKRYYRLIKRRQCVQFLGCENDENMFTSNFLKNFPKLKILRIVTLLNERPEFSDKIMYRVCVYESGLKRSYKKRSGRRQLNWADLLEGI